MEILIKYHADIDRIEKIDVGDWIDLRAAKDTFIELGKSGMIPLGISMKLPEGFEAHILPRSSTFMKYGIIMTNGMGIIDNSYSGDNDIWQFPAFSLLMNGRFGGVPGSFIKKNDRICQFRLVRKQSKNIDFTEVQRLLDSDRGGFGSTGSA